MCIPIYIYIHIHIPHKRYDILGAGRWLGVTESGNSKSAGKPPRFRSSGGLKYLEEAVAVVWNLNPPKIPFKQRALREYGATWELCSHVMGL